MDIEIAGFIKHWGQKGRIEVRRRGVVDKLQNFAHTDNRALQQIYHDGHTILAQLTDLFIVYQCQCDRALCTTVFWKYNQTLQSMSIYASLISCTPLTLECIHPTL